MSGAHQGVFMNQRSFSPPPGQDAYTSPGTYSWVAPDGVTSVSAVAVGGGSLRTGGGLGYKNAITVTPGNSYTVVVASGVTTTTAGNSYFVSACTVRGGGGLYIPVCGGTYVGDGGGNGGGSNSYGGGGAGGYSGNGGQGAATGDGANGSGGAAGGGAGREIFCIYYGAGGGGVGILGQGASGSGGVLTCVPGGGGGGSGGATASDGPSGGGAFGGGGSLYCHPCFQCYIPGAGGAVRIIWPSPCRAFPSTRTADE
jgi:hypothetical protein